MVVDYEIEVSQEKDGVVTAGKVIAIMDMPWARYTQDAPKTYRAEIFAIYPPEGYPSKYSGQSFRGMGVNLDDGKASDKDYFDRARQLLQLMAQKGDIKNPRYAYVIQRIMAVMTDLTAQIVSRRIKALIDSINEQFQSDVPAYSTALIGGLKVVLDALESQLSNMPDYDFRFQRKGAQTAVDNANAAITALNGLWSIVNTKDK